MFLARQPSVKPLSSSVVAALCRDISERLCRQQQQLEPGHKVNRVAAEAAVTAAVVAALDAWQKLEVRAIPILIFCSFTLFVERRMTRSIRSHCIIISHRRRRHQPLRG